MVDWIFQIWKYCNPMHWNFIFSFYGNGVLIKLGNYKRTKKLLQVFELFIGHFFIRQTNPIRFFRCFCFLTYLLAGCRCTGTFTGNNVESVPKFVMGDSIQCCCRSHSRWSTPSPVWFCHDTFSFRSAKFCYSNLFSFIGMVKKPCSMLML